MTPERLSEAIRPAVFVDTSALHFISQYLKLAVKHEFAPYGAQGTWSEIDAELRLAGLLKSQRDSLKKGYASLAFLQRAAQEESQILVSEISLAEIVHGLVEGIAHFRMAEAGVPYRMRQRSSDLSQLVREWMGASDYERVRRDAEGLPPELERLLQTEIRIAGRQSANREVLSLMQVILGHVYFDVIDCWLLAEALTEQAQLILTFDGYFEETINRIRDPSGIQDDEAREMWTEVRSSLQVAVASIFMLPPERAALVVVPQAIKPAESKSALLPAISP